jgi:hypothetical protein
MSLKEMFGRHILNGKTDAQLAKSLKELEAKGLGDRDMAKLIRRVQEERKNGSKP